MRLLDLKLVPRPPELRQVFVVVAPAVDAVWSCMLVQMRQCRLCACGAVHGIPVAWGGLGGCCCCCCWLSSHLCGDAFPAFICSLVIPPLVALLVYVLHCFVLSTLAAVALSSWV